MSQRHQFTDASDAMTFLQAGNSTLTVVSKKTTARYTYRIRESDDGKVFFVSVMFGPDNETSYCYIGIIRNGEFKWTQKSKVAASDVRWKAFDWIYKQLSANKLPDSLEIWHEGKCGRCGRKLTVPLSIVRGIGPECWTRTGHGDPNLFDEQEMQRMEAEGDREQTKRDEEAKMAARDAMEQLV